jgi:hypothetical protein
MAIFINFIARIVSNLNSKCERVYIGPTCPIRSRTTCLPTITSKAYMNSLIFSSRTANNQETQLLDSGPHSLHSL